MPAAKNFFEKVWEFTKKIPQGKVATYGQIAALISAPRAARQVGWALHLMPENQNIPWHRVINSKGYISTTCLDHPAELQKKLLEKEEIEIKRKNNLWQIDLKKYLWRKY